MKKAFILLLSSSILCLGSMAYSLERKAPVSKAPNSDRLEAFGKRLKAAVAAGKLTEKEAIAKWESAQKAAGARKDASKGKKPLPPKRPAKPQISDEVNGQLEAIKKDKDALKKAIGDELEKLGLGKDSSKEEVRAAVDAFKKANKDRFDAIKAASDKVHEALKAARPERKKRPEPTPEIKAKIAAVKAVGKKLHEARTGLRKDLKDASKEDQKALIQKFRADNKDKHQELKAKQKELKEAIRAVKESGEKRAGQ